MICPNCERSTVVPVTKDISFTYDGEVIVFESVMVLVCPTCDYEGIEEVARIDKMLTKFRRAIDAKRVMQEDTP